MIISETTTTTVLLPPLTYGWGYMNLFSLVFITLWSVLSLVAIYYLWCAFNMFQIEIQDISYEIVDFRSNEIDAKPREICRLLNLRDDPSSRALLTV